MVFSLDSFKIVCSKQAVVINKKKKKSNFQDCIKQMLTQAVWQMFLIALENIIKD